MSIAIDRVIQKLDEHLNRNDLAAAERHLSYWRAEAEVSDDERARLTLLNEQIGLYRKLGKEKECMEAVAAALGEKRPEGSRLVKVRTFRSNFQFPMPRRL